MKIVSRPICHHQLLWCIGTTKNKAMHCIRVKHFINLHQNKDTPTFSGNPLWLNILLHYHLTRQQQDAACITQGLL